MKRKSTIHLMTQKSPSQKSKPTYYSQPVLNIHSFTKQTSGDSIFTSSFTMAFPRLFNANPVSKRAHQWKENAESSKNFQRDPLASFNPKSLAEGFRGEHKVAIMSGDLLCIQNATLILNGNF